MKNNPYSSAGNSPEHNEPTVQDAERGPSTANNSEEILLDYLIEQGFVWEEAMKLVRLREHLYDNAEIQQRMAEDNRMQFVHWLYEQGEIKEA